MTIGGFPLPGPVAALALDDDPPELDPPELLDELLDELPQAATTKAMTIAVNAPRARTTYLLCMSSS
jgi:hypothetical protein